MLTKLLITALVLVLAWRLLAPRPRRRSDGGPRRLGAIDLSRCPRCGIYRFGEAGCRCSETDGA